MVKKKDQIQKAQKVQELKRKHKRIKCRKYLMELRTALTQMEAYVFAYAFQEDLDLDLDPRASYKDERKYAFCFLHKLERQGIVIDQDFKFFLFDINEESCSNFRAFDEFTKRISDEMKKIEEQIQAI